MGWNLCNCGFAEVCDPAELRKSWWREVSGCLGGSGGQGGLGRHPCVTVLASFVAPLGVELAAFMADNGKTRPIQTWQSWIYRSFLILLVAALGRSQKKKKSTNEFGACSREFQFCLWKICGADIETAKRLTRHNDDMEKVGVTHATEQTPRMLRMSSRTWSAFVALGTCVVELSARSKAEVRW